MEILALLAGILAAIIFVSERLAFAIMLYMLISWVWRATAVPRAFLHREMLVLVGQMKWLREAVQMWWMMRTLRRQFLFGATP